MVHAEKDSGRPCPMLHPVAGLIHIVSLIFFFFFEKRKIDSMIRELKRKDFIYSMNFYFFFFYQILLLFP